MPVAEIVVLGIVLHRSVASIGKLQKAYQTALEMEASWHHCAQLIAEAAQDPEPNPGRLRPRFERAIAFERVCFAYDHHRVLDELDLEIRAGSLTVLTGPSGAGKTTLIDLVLGLHRPERGRILVDGVSLNDIDLIAWRRMIGYVPQETVLFHDTIRANLALGDDSFQIKNCAPHSRSPKPGTLLPLCRMVLIRSWAKKALGSRAGSASASLSRGPF